MSNNFENAHEILGKFLNKKQIDKICKYWRVILQYNHDIENFNYAGFNVYTVYYDDDDENIKEMLNYNKRLQTRLDTLNNRRAYFEAEYEKYLERNNMQLGDPSYDEILFNFINNGVVIQ